MPKVGKYNISVVENGERLRIEYTLNVNSEGLFTTTLKEEDVNMIESYGIELPNNGRRNARSGFFSAHSKQEIEEKIKSVLINCLSRELLSKKIVLRYSIETSCSFCLTKDGTIIPNRGWKHDGEIDEELGWQNGTFTTHATNKNPTGIMFFIKPYTIFKYKYGNGLIKTEEKEWTPFGSNIADPKKQYYLSWLENVCSTIPPRNGSTREIEYTEERAKFFVDIYKELSKIAWKVSMFVEPKEMIDAIENKSNLLTMDNSQDQ